jgi:hypothetical protein|tara:strand:- start:703 stop:1053 length:351 start_codon:yes stop_codon:yes gene_type:complete
MAMTEISFTREQCPDIRRFQLDTTDQNKATQVNIPDFARMVTIRPNGGKARLSFTTSSDSINDDYIKLSGDTPTEFTIFKGHRQFQGINRIFIANITGVTGRYVEVMIEAGDRPEK